MVKKTLLGVIFATGLVFSQTAMSPEQFFFDAGYKKGYKEGYEKGYKEGYKQAVKDFKTVLQAYKDDIKALEMGKYLFRNGYITYPRVYRLNENGKVEFKIVGCRLEKIRSLEDVIRNPWQVPEIDCNKIQNVEKASKDLITIPETPVQTEPFSYEKSTVIIIPLKVRDTALLNRLGIPYMTNPETGKVKAIFFDLKRAEQFCNQYKICY
jgi:hypothetical protein